MKKILFQGDSITDAGRGDNSSPLNGGYGYANLVRHKRVEFIRF